MFNSSFYIKLVVAGLTIYLVIDGGLLIAIYRSSENVFFFFLRILDKFARELRATMIIKLAMAWDVGLEKEIWNAVNTKLSQRTCLPRLGEVLPRGFPIAKRFTHQGTSCYSVFTSNSIQVL